jgi:hypothetical protein
MSIISLEKLLKSGQSGDLEKIVQIAQDMDKLTSAVRQGLAPDLSENVIAASVRGDSQLVITASSSAWASKIRFEEATLLRLANHAGAQVDSLRVSVSRGS